MSIFSKKIVSATLTATTSVWLSGAMLLVPAAHAQTTADLQAQIAALLAQIQQLQAQLAGQSGGGSMMAACTFTRDLTVGVTGDDVKCLQQWLNGHGYPVASSGAGSPGNESMYFGSLTRAAVSAWQAANNVTPSVGYFGPKSRAAFAAMGGGTGTGTGTGTGGVVPASGLAVSLATGSTVGSAIAGAGQINIGRFNFTASNQGAVVITGLEFKKVGVLSDSNINNLYLADAGTGEIVGQYQSLTNGVGTFSGLNLVVNPGQTWVGELRMDLATGATAGNTIAWQLTNVVTSGGSTVTGTPSTNTLTVTTVSNPSIASLSLTANAVGSSVDAGTNSVLVSSWTANVSNSAVNLTNMQFTFVGSANPGDIKNLKLMVNGLEVATLPQAGTNTNFNFAANPVKLSTGQATIEIFADVLGSPNRTFTFSLLQPYRVTAIDTQYNTGITVSITSTNQTTVSINTGSVTVSLSSNTPTQPVPIGASNVTLAKFRVYAAGEPVKVKFLQATITGTGTVFTSATTSDMTNVKMIDDAGGQLGNTISSVGTSDSAGANTCGAASATVVNCYFGTSGSPINYTVPANTSRELSLVVDIASDFVGTTLRGALLAGSQNLEGQISYQQASSGAANGATLSITTTPLSVAANSAFAAPTYVAGANEQKIASFVVTASSAQGARITSLTFDKDSNASMDIQNLKVMVGATQFGTTRATIGTAETSLAFSGSTPVQVPQGGSVVIDVYADILTTTDSGSQAAVIDLIGWSALGNISNSAITFPGAVSGQNITISTGPTLTVAAASETSPAKQVVMGSTGNSLFTLRLTADNVEDIRVTDLTLQDTITNNTTGTASFMNIALYDGTTLVGGPVAMSLADTASGTLTFSLLSGGVIVPKNGTKNLELKGDVATFSSGGAKSGSGHTFSVAATSSVTALGKDSNQSATVSGAPNGNAATVYRTKVSLAAQLLGSASGRARVAVDDIANLNFTANSAYQALLGTVSLKFSGLAVSAGSTAFSVDLIDANTNVSLGSAGATNCTPGAGNSCTVTFSPQFTIDAGTTKVTKVRVNSASFFNAAVAGTESLSVLVNATTDVLVNDGTTAAIPLEGTVVPFTLTNVSYE